MITPRDTIDRTAVRQRLYMQTGDLLTWFEHDQLPDHLLDVGQHFHALAWSMAATYPDGGAELTVTLRKLLEARDCALRVADFYRTTGRKSKENFE